MEVGVLGSTMVVGPGGPADGLARKPRALLAALAPLWSELTTGRSAAWPTAQAVADFGGAEVLAAFT